jgi:hypothetical protein
MTTLHANNRSNQKDKPTEATRLDKRFFELSELSILRHVVAKECQNWLVGVMNESSFNKLIGSATTGTFSKNVSCTKIT